MELYEPSHKVGRRSSRIRSSSIITTLLLTSDGTVVEQRSFVRVSLISDAFWSVINFIGLFIDTLVNPNKKRPAYQSRAPPRNGNFRGNGPKGANIKSLPKDCGPKG